uniref:Chromosome 9 open reading frame 85 n=1 Tax=Xenopus tropicalis TaxID=8364 RepID=A0A803J762_XENTR
MSSQRGNVNRSRAQKHKNATVFKNDKYDSSSRTKKINAKLHDGVCQHCKDVLEWRVKFSKYKPLSQPKKCVKCLQKTVKDSYHIICKPCAIQHELCAKCGKKEEIVLPCNGTRTFQKVQLLSHRSTRIGTGQEASNNTASNRENLSCDEEEEEAGSDLDFDIDLEASDDEFKEGKNKNKKPSKNKAPTGS